MESTGISNVLQNKGRQFEHRDNRNNNKTTFFFQLTCFACNDGKLIDLMAKLLRETNSLYLSNKNRKEMVS